MSSSQGRRPTPLNLDSHPDVRPGQSTDGTDESTPQDVVARRLAPIPRPPGPNDSSPEPSPNAVPDLDSDASTRSSTEDLGANPLRNTFAGAVARARERNEDESHVEGLGRNTTGLSVEPDSNRHARSSIRSTPTQYYFPYEAHAERYRTSRDAAMHAESLRSHSSADIRQSPPPTPQLSNLTTPPLLSLTDDASDNQHQPISHAELSNTNFAMNATPSRNISATAPPSSPSLHGHASSKTLHHASLLSSLLSPRPTVRATHEPAIPAPQTTHTESDQDELPPRPEPPALTTIDRFQRGLRHILGHGNTTTNDGTEMATFRRGRTSVSHPHLFTDGTAAAIRSQEQERQHEDDRLQAQRQPAQQQAVAEGGSSSRQGIPMWA